jgi:hypothetical protein
VGENQARSVAYFTSNQNQSFQVLIIMNKYKTEYPNKSSESFEFGNSLNPKAASFVLLDPKAQEFVPRATKDKHLIDIDITTSPSMTSEDLSDVPRWRCQPISSYRSGCQHNRGSSNRSSAPRDFRIPGSQDPKLNVTSDDSSASFSGFSAVQYMDPTLVWIRQPPRSASVSPHTIPAKLVAPMLYGPQYSPWQPYHLPSLEASLQAITVPLFERRHADPSRSRTPDISHSPTSCHPTTFSSVANENTVDKHIFTVDTSPTAYKTVAPSVPGVSAIVHGSRQADLDLFNLTGYPIDRAMLRTHIMNLGTGMRRNHSSGGRNE